MTFILNKCTMLTIICYKINKMFSLEFTSHTFFYVFLNKINIERVFGFPSIELYIYIYL